MFTTGISGVAHLKMGYVNKKLFFGLLLPGIVGALVGTYILSHIDGKALKPYISVYLLVMGVYVFSKAFRHIKPTRDIQNKKVIPFVTVIKVKLKITRFSMKWKISGWSGLSDGLDH